MAEKTRIQITVDEYIQDLVKMIREDSGMSASDIYIASVWDWAEHKCPHILKKFQRMQLEKAGEDDEVRD